MRTMCRSLLSARVSVGPLYRISLKSFGSQAQVQSMSLQATTVPEPGHAVVLMGLIGLMRRRGR